ncbi:MAG: lytic transglycosylase [Pseudomonadota bacterium]
MSRTLRAAILLLLVASCGGGASDVRPPRNLDNACAMLRERPDFRKAFERTERRWGVPVAVQMSTIYHESKFVGDARTPLRFTLGVIPMGRLSSAFGYSQALDGTWDEYLAEQKKRGARRDNIDDATDFMGWYMTNTESRLGIPKTDAFNQYLAYHEGHTGYARGSYRRKAWLVDYAESVADRAVLYDTQLRGCR